MSTTRHLIDRLKVDKVLRNVCGFVHISHIPSESVFSRAFDEFSKSSLGEQVHDALIQTYQSDRLIGHISRDSSAIEAREKPLRTEKEKIAKKAPKKRGRPKKGEAKGPVEETRIQRQLKMDSAVQMLADIPIHCDVGTKKNSKGYKHSWRGYKFHIDTADGDIPISCILTSASVHDSQVALPLATMTAKKVNSFYDLMDAAYDSEEIRAHSQSFDHVPLIDFNHRSKNDQRTFAPHEAQRYK